MNKEDVCVFVFMFVRIMILYLYIEGINQLLVIYFLFLKKI